MPITRDNNGRFAKSAVSSVLEAPAVAAPTPRLSPTTKFINRSINSDYKTQPVQFILNWEPVFARVSADQGITDIRCVNPADREYYTLNRFRKLHLNVHYTSGTPTYVVNLKDLPDNAVIQEDGVFKWNPEIFRDGNPSLRDLDSKIPYLLTLATSRVNEIYITSPGFNTIRECMSVLYNLYHSILPRVAAVRCDAVIHSIFFKTEAAENTVTLSDYYPLDMCFRFCKSTAPRKVVNQETLNKLLLVINAYTDLRYDDYAIAIKNDCPIIRSSSKIDLAGSTTSVNMMQIPSLDKDAKLALISNARASMSSVYAISYPMLSELEEIDPEFLKSVTDYLSGIPGLEIKYLRERHVVYHGGQGHAQALNYKYEEEKGERVLSEHLNLVGDISTGTSESISYVKYEENFGNRTLLLGGKSNALLFQGKAWAVYFTIEGKDLLGGNMVYFVTPDQYEACYANHPIHGNRYMTDSKGEPLKPSLPPFMYLCQNMWCERNDGHFSDDTKDFQVPYYKRMPLWVWIASNLISKTGAQLEGLSKPIVSDTRKLSKLTATKWGSQATATITSGLQSLSAADIEAIRNGTQVYTSVSEPVENVHPIIDLNNLAENPYVSVTTFDANVATPVNDDPFGLDGEEDEYPDDYEDSDEPYDEEEDN